MPKRAALALLSQVSPVTNPSGKRALIAVAVPERTTACGMRLLKLGVTGEADDGVLAVRDGSVALEAPDRRLRWLSSFLSN